jgi:hypothetical protein
MKPTGEIAGVTFDPLVTPLTSEALPCICRSPVDEGDNETVVLVIEDPREAVIWTLWVVVTGEAVAANEIDVAPLGIRADKGTDKAGLALER